MYNCLPFPTLSFAYVVFKMYLLVCWAEAHFTPQQEAFCIMVIANNAIRLKEIKSHYRRQQSVSISTINMLLKRFESCLISCGQSPTYSDV